MRIDYVLEGDRIVYQKYSTGEEIWYNYDAAGKLLGFHRRTADGLTGNYYYIRNGQGDILGFHNQSGRVVVRYTYDAWGKVISISGSMAGTLGKMNPFRYRGYYYDEETELYYLNSRYYNPEWGRFVNGDAILLSNPGMMMHNLFAYCGNNPVNLYDPTGYCSGFAGICPVCGQWSNSYMQDKYSNSKKNKKGFTVFSPVKDKRENPSKNTPPDHPDFKPPKKGTKKVRNPNGKGRGWQAGDGGVWVWDPNMHGDPGWVVQYPGGKHKHAYPGGGVRSHYESNEDMGLATLQLIGGAVMVIVLVADDATGIGVADDPLIGAAAGCMIGGLDAITGKKTCTECGGYYYGF